jgi:hypothetical protein
MDIWIVVKFNLAIEYRSTVLHALKNVVLYDRMYKKGEKWYDLTISFTHPSGICPNLCDYYLS